MSKLREALFLAALALPGLVWALDAGTSDPRAIMTAVEERATGDRMTARLSIAIADKAGRERTRAVQIRAMEFDGGRKQLMLFEAPADVRNAGLLSIDWDDGNKADDQWLYLPSLAKTTRISGADRSGSFMGTDLTYADMTARDPDRYDYTLVEANVEVDGEACWLIEARPKSDEEKAETGYLKTQVWVSKEKLLPVQIKAWVTEGKKLKYTKFSDVRKVGEVWMAHQIVVRTVRDGQAESTSTLVFSDVVMDAADVTAEDFTERRLEKGL